MNYGYNVAAAGVLTAMFRQDVASNNLANIETVGFKGDTAFTIPREAARIEDRLSIPSNRMLERLGAGVLLAPVRTSFAQGTLTPTKNPLDVAVKGDGFLAVGKPGSPDQVRLTRDGRMTLNPAGELVLASSGERVLSETGQAIRLSPTAEVTIDGDGLIRQNGAEAGRIQFVDVPDRKTLRKLGANLFQPPAGVKLTKATGEINQYSIEQSTVDPVRAMMAVQSAANAVSSAVRVMSMTDEMTGRVINSLGKVT